MRPRSRTPYSRTGALLLALGVLAGFRVFGSAAAPGGLEGLRALGAGASGAGVEQEGALSPA
ncbi:MAG: hypothetical protein ACRDHM_06625, partial [Actinomycetota bacterium]